MLLQRLKTFELVRCEMDELIEMSAYAAMLSAEYETRKVEPPDWLVARRRELGSAIKVRNEDALRLRLARVRDERVRLEAKAQTPAERLAAKVAEEHELAAALGE